jgi:hypothetical protein
MRNALSLGMYSPAALFNISIARCVVEPVPAEA